jgi:hypothetical protein
MILEERFPGFSSLNLTPLLPQETLYSWCATFHAINGNHDVLDTNSLLFGVPYAGLAHDIPSYLEALCTRTRGCLGTSTDLATKHTVLGYYLPFLHDAKAMKTLSTVCGGNAAHIKMTLGIPATRVGAAHPLKACDECMAEDRSRHGYSFWRVEHQYPSSIVCLRHRRTLRLLALAATPVHQRRWFLPDSTGAAEWTNPPVVAVAQLDRLAKLAEYSSLVATMPPGQFEPQKLGRTYRAALAELGLVTAHGSLRSNLLVQWLSNEYEGLADIPALSVLNAVRPDWLGLLGLSRKLPRQGHPLKHLVLISALFDNWTDFLDAYEAGEKSDQAVCTLEAQCQPALDARHGVFTCLVRSGLSVSAAARSMQITTTTAVRWAKLLHLPFTPRPKSLYPDVLQTARKLLPTGQSKSNICIITGISMVSLNRLISSEPAVAEKWRAARFELARRENRRRFLLLVKNFPGQGIKDLRKHPANGYAWLYRHDRDWLAAHLPALWQQ